MKKQRKTPINKKPTFKTEYNLLNGLINQYKNSKSSNERQTIEESFFEKYESVLKLFDNMSIQNKSDLLSLGENFRELKDDFNKSLSQENSKKNSPMKDLIERKENLDISFELMEAEYAEKNRTFLNQQESSSIKLLEKVKEIEELIQPKDIEVKEVKGQKIETLVSKDDDLKKLNDLKKQVADATSSYNKHSESIWFCFFHWHGSTGRTRANKFHNEFNQIKDLHTAKSALISYLSNNANGNTHPHSFRTMLLNEISMNSKHTLQKISANYDKLLNNLESAFGLKSENQTNKI